MSEALEWHKATLQRDREQLAAMLAACKSPEAECDTILVLELRNRIAMIEKILAASDHQKP
jgi:hypothetical protein